MSRIIAAFASLLVQAAASISPTVEIAPGVLMPRINLGTCCGSSPAVGLTSWLDNGGTGIDTAYDYGDQGDIGAILKKRPSLKRSDFFITTKIPAGFGQNGTDCDADPAIAVKYVRENLKELGLEYVDLVLLHAPCERFVPPVPDPVASNNALWAGLESLLASGATRAIGVSNYNRTHLQGLKGRTPALNQCEMSLTGSFGQPGHDEDTLSYCLQNKIQYESYGALKGCPFNDTTVLRIGKAHELSPAQLCLRWVLERGAVVATGTGSNASRVDGYAKSDMAVLAASALTADEIDQLNKLQDKY